MIELTDEASDQGESEEEEGAEGGLERVEEDEMEEDVVDMATLTFSKHQGRQCGDVIISLTPSSLSLLYLFFMYKYIFVSVHACVRVCMCV